MPLEIASQRVLQVPELLLSIFDQLSKSDKYSVARVCKEWSEFAIPALWRNHLIRFGDLIHNLDLLSHPLEGLLGMVLVYERDQDQISHSDWQRFLWFSRHIRELAVKDEWSNKSLMLSLSNLSHLFGGNILQNLHSITIRPIPLGNHIFPTKFFSPNLRSIVLGGNGESHTGSVCSSFLRMLGECSPYLEEITISNPMDGTILFTFDSFIKLRSLRLIGSLALATLRSILQSSSLCNLSLTRFTLDPFPESAHSARRAWLDQSTVWSMSNIETIELGSIVNYDDQWEQFWTSVWDQVSFPSLKELKIVDSSDEMLGWLRRLLRKSQSINQVYFKLKGPFDTQIFQSLSQYSNLKQLDISDVSVEVRDIFGGEKLEDLLSLLPGLECFVWTFPDCAELSPVLPRSRLVDLDEILGIVNKHPRLLRLSLPLDARHVLSELQQSRRQPEVPSDDSNVKHTTTTKSLKLVVFDLKSSELEVLTEALIELLPDALELTMVGRPINGFFIKSPFTEPYVTNRAIEGRSRELIPKIRAEKKQRQMNSSEICS